MKKLFAFMALLLIACESMQGLMQDAPYITPTVSQEMTSTPEVVVVTTTPEPTATLYFDALYEAQVIVDQLIIRRGNGEETGVRLNAGDYVTVVQQEEYLDIMPVPEPPGGQWCLIEPREFDEWVACDYLRCTRHCE